MAKILAIDDEVQLIEMLKMRLEANGYNVVPAYDWDEGIEQVKSENPNLTILDIMMPRIDGFEACKILKNNPQYCNIPIIFLSAKVQEHDLKLIKCSSADALIKKPF